MSLSKQSDFLVTNRTETFNGTDVSVEIILSEVPADPTATPNLLALRSLSVADAAQFVTGKLVTLTIGAVIKAAGQPTQAITETPAQPSLLDKALNLIGLGPNS